MGDILEAGDLKALSYLKKIVKGVISKTAKFFSFLASFGASSLLPPLLSATPFLRVQEQKSRNMMSPIASVPILSC